MKTKRRNRPTEGVRRYLGQLGEFPPLTRDDEREINEALLRGDEEARGRLVEGAMQYVVKMAKHYARVSSADLDELIAAGNEGLVDAARRYDPSRENRFLSYANWYIRNSMRNALRDRSRPVRLTGEFHGHLRKVRREQEKRAARGAPPMSAAQIARFLDASDDMAERLYEWTRPESDVPAPDPKHLPEAPGFAGRVLEDRQGERIRALLDEVDLTEREREVVEVLCGFHSGAPLNVREAGDHLGVSHQAVSQAFQRARRRIRSSNQLDALRCYWEDLPGMAEEAGEAG